MRICASRRLEKMRVTKAYFLLLYVNYRWSTIFQRGFQTRRTCAYRRARLRVIMYVRTLQKEMNGERKESECSTRNTMSREYAVFYCQHVLTLCTNILLLSNFYRNIIYVSIKLQSATIRLNGNDAINLVTIVIVRLEIELKTC